MAGAARGLSELRAVPRGDQGDRRGKLIDCLLYTLEHERDDELRIIKQCFQTRRQLPEFIRNAPELHLGLELFYTAFFDLTGDRHIGMGPGPIPWSAMVAYASINGLDEGETDDLLYFLRKMDHEYLRYHQRRMEEKSKK